MPGRRAARCATGCARPASPRHEADVRFAMRYLIDRGIRGALAIAGRGRERPGARRRVRRPRARARRLDAAPAASSRSTSRPTRRRAGCSSIALHGCGVVRGAAPHAGRAGRCPGGRAGLRDREGAARGVRPPRARARPRRAHRLERGRLRPRRARAHRRARCACRSSWPRPGRPAPARRRRGARRARRPAFPGRVVLDGIQLLRGAFIRMDDYGLDAVARAVLGEGKTLARRTAGPSEILRLFKEDRPRLRRVQPHRRAPGPRDPRAAAPGRAGGRAQPAHRHAARPRGRLDRRLRLPLPGRAAAAAASWRRACARRRPTRAAGGRPRARAAARASTRTWWCSTSRACTRA